MRNNNEPRLTGGVFYWGLLFQIIIGCHARDFLELPLEIGAVVESAVLGYGLVRPVGMLPYHPFGLCNPQVSQPVAVMDALLLEPGRQQVTGHIHLLCSIGHVQTSLQMSLSGYPF